MAGKRARPGAFADAPFWKMRRAASSTALGLGHPPSLIISSSRRRMPSSVLSPGPSPQGSPARAGRRGRGTGRCGRHPRVARACEVNAGGQPGSPAHVLCLAPLPQPPPPPVWVAARHAGSRVGCLNRGRWPRQAAAGELRIAATDCQAQTRGPVQLGQRTNVQRAWAIKAGADAAILLPPAVHQLAHPAHVRLQRGAAVSAHARCGRAARRGAHLGTAVAAGQGGGVEPQPTHRDFVVAVAQHDVRAAAARRLDGGQELCARGSSHDRAGHGVQRGHEVVQRLPGQAQLDHLEAAARAARSCCALCGRLAGAGAGRAAQLPHLPRRPAAHALDPIGVAPLRLRAREGRQPRVAAPKRATRPTTGAPPFAPAAFAQPSQSTCSRSLCSRSGSSSSTTMAGDTRLISCATSSAACSRARRAASGRGRHARRGIPGQHTLRLTCAVPTR